MLPTPIKLAPFKAKYSLLNREPSKVLSVKEQMISNNPDGWDPRPPRRVMDRRAEPSRCDVTECDDVVLIMLRSVTRGQVLKGNLRYTKKIQITLLRVDTLSCVSLNDLYEREKGQNVRNGHTSC